MKLKERGVELVLGLVLVLVLASAIYWNMPSNSITGNAIYNAPFSGVITSSMAILNNGVMTFSLPRSMNVSSITLNWSANSTACKAKIYYNGNSSANITSILSFTSSNAYSQPTFSVGRVVSNLSINVSGCASKSNVKLISLKVNGLVENYTLNPALIIPSLSSYPSDGCFYGRECSGFEITAPAGLQLPYVYELQWTYNYTDSSSKVYCSTFNSNEDVNCTQVEGLIGVSGADDSAYDFSPIIMDIPLGKLVSGASVRVALWNNSNRSNWSASFPISVKYDCMSSCLVFNSTNCSNPSLNSKYQVCGYYNSSNYCLSWGNEQSCGSAYICNGSSIFNSVYNKCQYTGSGGTCTGVNQFCSSEIIPVKHSISRSDATCGFPGLRCYQCNDTGFSSNINKTGCVMSPYLDNCTSHGGTCVTNKNYLTVNATINSFENKSLECGDGSYCFICGNDTHSSNGTCVQNACGGVKPSSANVLYGSNVSLTGDARSWNYSTSSSLGACQWRCNTSYKLSSDGSCVYGAPTCDSLGGICSNVSVINASVQEANCSSFSQQCYVCNSAFGLKNGACVYGSCSAGMNWTGIICAAQNDFEACFFQGKCLVNGTCLSAGFRMNGFYCNEDSFVFSKQKAVGASCSIKQECDSNYCDNGKCFDVVQSINQNVGLLNKVLCWFQSVFGGQNYDSCIASAAS